MKWKSKIDSGSHFDFPVMGIDVYATIAAATNCPLPPDRRIDGKNLFNYIEGDDKLPHEFLYWQRGNCKAISSGDTKVIWNEEFQDTLVYEIIKDPFEKSDLPKGEKVRHLIGIHDRWSEELHDPLWPSIVYFREWVDGRWVYFDN